MLLNAKSDLAEQLRIEAPPNDCGYLQQVSIFRREPIDACRQQELHAGRQGCRDCAGIVTQPGWRAPHGAALHQVPCDLFDEERISFRFLNDQSRQRFRELVDAEANLRDMQRFR